jgi:hypothetical protein
MFLETQEERNLFFLCFFAISDKTYLQAETSVLARKDGGLDSIHIEFLHSLPWERGR